MTWYQTWCVALMTTAGCAASDTVSFEGVLQEHRDESSEAFVDCGHAAVGNECRTAISEAEACLVEAFANCTQAELRLDIAGVDAGFDVAIFVDATADGSCEVSRFTDNSADRFKGDYGDYVETGCAALTAVEPEPGAGICAAVSTAECEKRQEWYE